MRPEAIVSVLKPSGGSDQTFVFGPAPKVEAWVSRNIDKLNHVHSACGNVPLRAVPYPRVMWVQSGPPHIIIGTAQQGNLVCPLPATLSPNRNHKLGVELSSHAPPRLP